jgi:hypothetical protein
VRHGLSRHLELLRLLWLAWRRKAVQLRNRVYLPVDYRKLWRDPTAMILGSRMDFLLLAAPLAILLGLAQTSSG